jgi:glycosyltransferase 2 family protein
VGGDLVRGGMACVYSRSRAAIVLGSLMDRVQDVGGLLGVTAIGILFLPGSLDSQANRRVWMIAAVLAVAGLAGVGSLFVIPARKFPMKVRRIMVKLRRGVRSMYRKPGRMLTCFLIGMALQVSQVVINYYLGELAGLHIGFAVWLFAWPLAKLSALVPVTQGGIGVREVALVSLMAPFGAPPVLTAAVGLSFQATVITGGLIGGMLAFAMGRLSSTARNLPAMASLPEQARSVANG